MSDPGAPDLLRFWFEECQPAQWFRKDPAFDQQVRERFGPLSERALAGDLQPWADQPGSALALVLLLDQLPRQLRRDQPGAFAGDAAALELSLAALARGWIEAEAQPSRRQFWLMPVMHSEDLAIQEQGLKLFERFTDTKTTEFARRHRDVIARFGRFPHRNEALGRSSSAEELAFLEQPGSRF
ncbi:DUF924 domain-containing protein [Synechococcus sp. CS-1329]|jgi:uncharacterized protein (DUF924 family)|uniref:DUF924 family protein n=1 Tax=Synechococcus sp. CS-1329 TaxID=2847975 RepID=UPI00223B44BC|nr:DUF924 family protein [Synechococcus sp. CS-1329]MCT0219622.1 DUF924 domain-containing protein [Synechococcus sp. CS-1329]